MAVARCSRMSSGGLRHEKIACGYSSVGRRCGRVGCDRRPGSGSRWKRQGQGEQPASPNYPAWAYAIPPAPPPGTTPPVVNDDGKMLSLPGTNLQFTFNKVRGRLNNETPDRVAPADWYPQDHPTMPKIVSEGDNARGIIACSLCHLPPGKGRPENAPPSLAARRLHDAAADGHEERSCAGAPIRARATPTT